jgi:predicted RNase H-like HicB family nuclease
MTKKRKLLEKILNSQKNISFDDLVTLVEAFGFSRSRVTGSHYIFEHPNIPEPINRSMKDYHINVFYSEEDEGYIADIPDLKYCSAFGETPEEAVREVEIAKASWIEAAKAAGKPIPKPKYRPVIYQVG